MFLEKNISSLFVGLPRVKLVHIKSDTFHCAFKACDVLEKGGKNSSQNQIGGFSSGILLKFLC